VVFNSGSIFTRNRFYSSVSALFVLLLTLTVSYAQRTSGINTSGTDGNEEIQGRVFFPLGDNSSARPVVKLQSLS